MMKISDAVEQSYFICTTQRSGSHFLASGLKQSRLLGDPQDYFVPHVRQEFGEFFLGDYVEFLKQHSTEYGNVLAVKMTWVSLRDVCQEYQGSEGSELSKIEILQKLFPNPKFIFLKRRDKLAQSISLYKAKLENVWGIKTDGEIEKRPKQLKSSLTFDYEKIKEEKEKILRYEKEWEEFFEQFQIDPLVVYYEDCVKGYSEQLERISSFFYVGLNGKEIISEYQKQSNLTNLLWKLRYVLRSCFDRKR